MCTEYTPAPRRLSSPLDHTWRDLADHDLARYLARYRRALATLDEEPLDEATRADTRAFLRYVVAEATREEGRRVRAVARGVPRDKAPFPDGYVADLKARIHLDQLLEYELGAVLGRPGEKGTRRGPCPICRTSPRSVALAVYLADPADQRWWCFVGHHGGDAIDAIMVAYGESFPDAVRRLAAYGGVPLPDSREARRAGWAGMPGKVAE